MALPPGRPPDDHRHRHAKLPVMAPSHNTTNSYYGPTCEQPDESPLSKLQKNANHLKAMFGADKKNPKSNHPRYRLPPGEWEKTQTQRKKKTREEMLLPKTEKILELQCYGKVKQTRS